MVLTNKNFNGMILVDCLGTEIPGVLSFDDETFEVELIITGKSKIRSPSPDGKLIVVQPKNAILGGCHPFGEFEKVVIKTKILGAKLVKKDKKNNTTKKTRRVK